VLFFGKIMEEAPADFDYTETSKKTQGSVRRWRNPGGKKV
jgi:hypothetical protein